MNRTSPHSPSKHKTTTQNETSAQNNSNTNLVISMHTPIRSRTSDPEAADLDEAVQLFGSGLHDARSGHIGQGLPMIACAYLLDSRSAKFVPILRDIDDADSCLDMNLLQELIDFDGGNNIASQVLMIYAAIMFGQAEGGRTRILQALFVSSKLIRAISNDPTMANVNRGILGGCLKRPTLRRMRSTLYLSLGLPEMATQELSAALQLNPQLTQIRCARTCLYAELSSKSPNELVHDFRRVAKDSHPDARELRDAYAWLAKLVLENPSFGSYEQAFAYLGKSHRAKDRYEELYGPTPCSSIESEIEEAFAILQSAGAESRQWHDEFEHASISASVRDMPNHHQASPALQNKIHDKRAEDPAEMDKNNPGVSIKSRPPICGDALFATNKECYKHNLTIIETDRIPPLVIMDSSSSKINHFDQRLVCACVACGKCASKSEGIMHCSRCKTRVYCSKECQRKVGYLTKNYPCPSETHRVLFLLLGLEQASPVVQGSDNPTQSSSRWISISCLRISQQTTFEGTFHSPYTPRGET